MSTPSSPAVCAWCAEPRDAHNELFVISGGLYDGAVICQACTEMPCLDEPDLGWPEWHSLLAVASLCF